MLLIVQLAYGTARAQEPAARQDPVAAGMTAIPEHNALDAAGNSGVLHRAILQHRDTPDRGYWQEQPVKNPTLVWVGIGLVAVGTLALIGSLTVYQQSDLSEEQPNVRLNLHLAPCRTDPLDTDLPIADCKPHYGLMTAGIAMQGAGAGLILWGAQPAPKSPALQFRIRF
jgi:hypothetical protein